MRIDELSSLKGKVGKKMTLRIPLDTIRDEMITSIQPFINAAVKEDEHAVSLYVEVFDAVSGLSISSCSTHNIVLNCELFAILNEWRNADDSRFMYFVEK